MSDLSAPIYNDEDAAREHLESLRWAKGRFCPHCGAHEGTVKVEGRKQSHRAGLYYCNACGKQFTVMVGTLFERSHVKLHKWVLAFHLMSASKKGISAHQLARMLGVTYKTAWFMAHRIREAMRPSQYPGPMGQGGGTVEADETWIGPKRENMHRSKKPTHNLWQTEKEPVLALVERGGKVRSFHIDQYDVKAATLWPTLRLQISQSAHLRTDDAPVYRSVGRDFASHKAVNHSIGEYVRGDAHANTIEGYFAILKRGIYGTYQHVSGKHLKRYLGEFDFRYNTRSALGIEDAERAAIALKGIEGKRLTYRRTA